MKRAWLILAALALACWPVWRWYAVRVTESADEMWGLLALLTAVLFIARQRLRGAVTSPNLTLPACLLVVYAVTYHFFPPLLRAVIAFTTIGCLFGAPCEKGNFQFGLLGLLYLALPVIPSLQFYGGYPLRVTIASVSAPLLRLGGLAVFQDGTCLQWGSQLIWIDAPCSGIRMLWAGLYLACTLACLYELRWPQTLLALCAAGLMIMVGNIFRALALFYLEAGLVEAPAWAHSYVGLFAFAVIALGIAAALRRLRGNNLCDAQPST